MAKEYRLVDNAAGRAICGISSGGICSWTVAWERPDAFSKVLSHVGSFTNIRGGHVYPSLIRKTEPKPIRIFHAGRLGRSGQRPRQLAAGESRDGRGIEVRQYDYHFEYGDGGHNGKHGGAILPDSLRWLWRDYKTPN